MLPVQHCERAELKFYFYLLDLFDTHFDSPCYGLGSCCIREAHSTNNSVDRISERSMTKSKRSLRLLTTSSRLSLRLTRNSPRKKETWKETLQMYPIDSRTWVSSIPILGLLIDSDMLPSLEICKRQDWLWLFRNITIRRAQQKRTLSSWCVANAMKRNPTACLSGCLPKEDRYRNVGEMVYRKAVGISRQQSVNVRHFHIVPYDSLAGETLSSEHLLSLGAFGHLMKNSGE